MADEPHSDVTRLPFERAIEEQSRGRDAVLTLPTRFATGFMLGVPGGVFDCGPGRRSFGHGGGRLFAAGGEKGCGGKARQKEFTHHRP